MPFSDNLQHLDTICQRIADGRRWARLLASAVREYGMSEAEFRLLWLLCEVEQTRLEQSRLVERLRVSPAQVSALVEKLRLQQMITPVADGKDRRRKLWQLTVHGQTSFAAVITTVERISHDWAISESITGDPRSPLEDAA